ncbi:MAG: GNAT family N-acetyltransferase [Sphingopyxis sp.]|uniref:GNAT family N-acetyltransferase n=1 Tax=Sphingopyxis sp. TaxID=1908224 RepID=UPI002AB8862E|nr:GNAT family N-acetyltransferase [Sphingopyxis sp.]MDZ3832260.1 GNAT family N-acetyltransferase [Sphingopyxis sp.]
MANSSSRSIDDMAIHSRLNDGTAVLLRTIRPEDEDLLREAIAKLSDESRYLRFFSPAPVIPDAVIERLADVDGHDHIAWGALCSECEGQPAIGAVRAVRHKRKSDSEGRLPDGRVGEYSVAVIDAYHGQGLARMLTAALLVDCLAEGITELDVHILSENHAAAGLIRAMGGRREEESHGVADYRLDVAAGLEALRKDDGAPGVRDVLRQLGAA